MATEQRKPLAELVRRCNEQLSYREMERRAGARGHQVSHSTLADYAQDAVQKMPSKEQLEALAAALDLGLETVRAAALDQFWGYVPRELKNRKGSRLGAALPPDLTPEEEAELVRMVEAWVAARRRNP